MPILVYFLSHIHFTANILLILSLLGYYLIVATTLIDSMAGDSPYTLKELKMIALAGEIREKNNWARKIDDEDIVDEWWSEVSSKGVDRRMFDYVIAELEHYLTIREVPIEVL